MAITQKVVAALVRLATLLLSVTFITFILVEISPLDPVANYAARMQRGVSEEQLAAIAQRFGADLPWWERYFSWLGGVLQGDFGYSLAGREPVGMLLWIGISNSLLLMAIAWLLSGIGGYILGVVSGATRGSLLDRGIVSVCYLLTSTPTYVVGMVLLLVFAVSLGWSPVGLSQPLGVLNADVTWTERLRHVVLPAVTVALVAMASVALHTRQALTEVLDSEVARFARARSMGTWQIVYNHGLRKTLVVALTLQLTSLSMLFGGSVLAEVVFGYHGVGQMIVNAGLSSDVPLLLGAVTVTALLVFLGNFIGDIAARRLDPRANRQVSYA